MIFHTFYTENLPYSLVEDHKKICDHIGIDVRYHVSPGYADYDSLYTAHGDFMTSVLQQENDIACYLDIDCLPHNIQIIKEAYDWVSKNEGFIGNAQNISHTAMKNHVYAAASFLLINKKAWKRLGSPGLAWFNQGQTQIDTAQILTLRADQIGMPYRLMYPVGYDGPEEFVLSGYGKYGTGTLYPATWHYFRISKFKDKIPVLWSQRIDAIMNNKQIIPHNKSIFYGP